MASLSQFLDFAGACRRFERPHSETVIHGLLAVGLFFTYIPLWTRMRRLGNRFDASPQSSLIIALVSTEHLATTLFHKSYPVFAPQCAHAHLLRAEGVLSVLVDLLQPFLFWLASLSTYLIVIKDSSSRMTILLAAYILLALLPTTLAPVGDFSAPQIASDTFVWSRQSLLFLSTFLCVLKTMPQLSFSMQGQLQSGNGVHPWTLVSQTMIFACLSVFWCFRARASRTLRDETLASHSVLDWYDNGGWHVINFALLSAAQLYTFCGSSGGARKIDLQDDEIDGPYERYTDEPKDEEA